MPVAEDFRTWVQCPPPPPTSRTNRRPRPREDPGLGRRAPGRSLGTEFLAARKSPRDSASALPSQRFRQTARTRRLPFAVTLGGVPRPRPLLPSTPTALAGVGPVLTCDLQGPWHAERLRGRAHPCSDGHVRVDCDHSNSEVFGSQWGAGQCILRACHDLGGRVGAVQVACPDAATPVPRRLLGDITLKITTRSPAGWEMTLA